MKDKNRVRWQREGTVRGRWTVTKAQGRNQEKTSGPQCEEGRGGEGSGGEKGGGGEGGEEGKGRGGGRKRAKGRRSGRMGCSHICMSQLESPGVTSDQLDPGQERAHKLLVYCSCYSFVFH